MTRRSVRVGLAEIRLGVCGKTRSTVTSAKLAIHVDSAECVKNTRLAPVQELASSAVDAATIMPPTDSGVGAATYRACPCRSTSRYMCR
jgi:hypothetical protein